MFAGALAYLGWGIAEVPLASGFLDPVRKIRPQDEALYSSISIGMAGRGEWLTPRFLGRLAFVKPIGAFLPTALSVKAFGVSLWSLRLPSLLAGAALLTLLWRWQGWGPTLLVAANPLFFTLARRNMTDVPVLLFVALTIFFWNRHPALPLALGVLTKSVAGAVPLLFLWREGGKRWWTVFAIAAALVAPWHLYQLLGPHGDWYWKEHILDEHLSWGLATPENVSTESHAAFYLSRAWAIDPLLCLLLPAALYRARKRPVELGWLAASAAVLWAFGYRNATYLLPVFAATAAAVNPPVWLGATVLAWRLWAGEVSHAPPEPVGPQQVLDAYAKLHRNRGLIVDGVEDEFVATTLGLPRVQYILPGDARTLARTNVDFVGRGIIAPAYTGRPEPFETVILTQDLRQVMESATDRDFLVKRARTHGRPPLLEANGWAIVPGGR